jgi:predicted phosphate transport protein (TIGR00153 family)
MNIDTILKYFVPKDHAFFPLFERDAQNLIKTAEVLKLLLSTEDIEQQEVLTKQIKELEKIGDDITHTIFDQLNKSFITPFDREDIQQFGSNIDDVVDTINGVGQRIRLYKPKNYIPVYLEFAEILYQAAKEIEFSVKHLIDPSNNKDKIMKSCIAINTLENKADELYHIGISSLFENEKDPFELIKKKEILETLEKAVDKAEDVSDIIKTILVKMA